jgi:hypothetical protein
MDVILNILQLPWCYAKIIASNLTSLMALAAQKEVDKKTQKLQLTYQVNFAQALSKMKNQCSSLQFPSEGDIKS